MSTFILQLHLVPEVLTYGFGHASSPDARRGGFISEEPLIPLPRPGRTPEPIHWGAVFPSVKCQPEWIKRQSEGMIQIQTE